jgi:6-phosphogluconolactonase
MKKLHSSGKNPGGRSIARGLTYSWVVGLLLTVSLAGAQAGNSNSSSSGENEASGMGMVYTASNSSSGNEVVAYKRHANGELEFKNSFPTGGIGNDVALGGLGNQGGLVLGNGGHWLLVVNPGSDNLSVFSVKLTDGLQLTDKEPSNGTLPTSIAINGNLAYVLNAADPGSISGFTLDDSGALTPIPGSTRPLSGMPVTMAAQIGFSPDGSTLVVTEKATKLIDTYKVDANGLAGPPIINASAGETPFGFEFSQAGYLIVSEAFGGLRDISAVSSYSLNGDGTLNVITPSAPTNETAACWIVVTRSGKFAYTTNTGSGTVTGFHIDAATGLLTPLDADGVTADTGDGSVPIDEALSRDSAYLYVLNSGTQEILGFRVDPSLGSLEQVTAVGDVPVAAFGLAAR